MIRYEVNLDVESDVAPAFAQWLRDHVEEMLALPGFLGAEMFDVEDPPAGRRAFSVCYRLVDRAALDSYFTEHAARMRADGVRRFGGRFSASRRILSPLSVVSATGRVP